MSDALRRNAGNRAGGERPPSAAPRPGSRSKLGAQQRLFAHEYLIDRNATQAAIRAGYSEKSAASQACDLLKNPKVREVLDRGLEKLTTKTELSLERVVLELHRILLSDPAGALGDDGAPLPLKQWPEDLRRALSGMDVEELWEGRGEDREQVGHLRKYRFWSKTEASQQLLRVLGAFKDKVEHEHSFKSHAELLAEARRRAVAAAAPEGAR